MYSWIVPRVVFPLAERLGGREMWSEARRLRELQWRPRHEVEEGMLRHLRRLLAHAANHVPHYRDLMRRAGVRAEDIRALADLARLPITTKVDLRAGFPDRTTAAALPVSRRQKMTTSGSTGLPFEFYWDRSGYDVRFGHHLFSLEWAGVAIWDTRINIAFPSSFATNVVTPPSRLRELGRRILLGEHTLRLPADDLTGTALRALVDRIPRGRRHFLRGYPSGIAWLARQLTEERTPLRSYPKAVITYAESLTPMDASTIGVAFRCPVVNYYTSWDVPHLAQTCPDNPGALHVNSDRVILRVVRGDGSDAPPGEEGRVVVTDLVNYVMPFINYAIGDCAVMGPPCPCGRGLPTLSSVEGRDTEAIRTPAGRRISGVVLGHFLTFVARVIPYVLEYQAIQTAPGRVTLRIVPGKEFTPEFGGALQSQVESFLGRDMAVSLELVDRVPLEPSGKRLIVKTRPSGAATP